MGKKIRLVIFKNLLQNMRQVKIPIKIPKRLLLALNIIKTQKSSLPFFTYAELLYNVKETCNWLLAERERERERETERYRV